MKTVDAFVLSLENLAAHKLRTALTTLGMMFGVGAVIAMLSIGAGAEREALMLIERLGVNNVVVRAKTLDQAERVEVRKKTVGLSERDLSAIREAVPNVSLALPKIEIDPYKILSATGKSEGMLYGVSHEFTAITALPLSWGRFIDSRDESTHAQVAVIGASVQRDLFGGKPSPGMRVKVNDVWLEVIGVLEAEVLGDTNVGGVSVSSKATARRPTSSPTTGMY